MSDAVFRDEKLVKANGYPVLSRYDHGDPAQPLVVFLPGGGHLARIAYGHPGACPDDFLAHWIARKGNPFLALSHPTDASVYDEVFPDMTSTDWAHAVAQVIARTLDRRQISSRRILLIGWSMGGKVLPVLALAAKRHGFAIEMFAALASMPPLPGFSNFTPGGERLTSRGLWQVDAPLPGGLTRLARWREELRRQDALNGAVVVSEADYRKFYFCNSPIGLRGERQRYRAGAVEDDLPTAIADTAGLDWASYPITGVIAPTDHRDAGHTLTGPLLWAGINARALYQGIVEPALADGCRSAPERWPEVLRLYDELPSTLSRRVEGGHFFFLGRNGAEATVRQLFSLRQSARSLRGRLTDLMRPPTGHARKADVSTSAVGISTQGE